MPSKEYHKRCSDLTSASCISDYMTSGGTDHISDSSTNPDDSKRAEVSAANSDDPVPRSCETSWLERLLGWLFKSSERSRERYQNNPVFSEDKNQTNDEKIYESIANRRANKPLVPLE